MSPIVLSSMWIRLYVSKTNGTILTSSHHGGLVCGKGAVKGAGGKPCTIPVVLDPHRAPNRAGKLPLGGATAGGRMEQG